MNLTPLYQEGWRNAPGRVGARQAFHFPGRSRPFTGLSYQATETVKLHVGIKYIWIDDVKLFGTKVDVGDDLAITAGLSAKF